MNKLLITILSIWFASGCIFSHAQNEKTGHVYTEVVNVHINTDFLITGETLYYSIHCLTAEKSKHSTLSKVAYVELIGENEKPALQTKVSLTDGRGAGDFFLPSTLPSGIYTLIVYTKWMRNFPLENFFQKQITIINPYLKSDITETIQGRNNTLDSIDTSSLKIKKEANQVNILIDKKKYSQRQKVVVVIKNNNPTLACNVSLNVHSYDKSAEKIQATLKTQALQPAPQLKKEFIAFLPDLRGETIGGIIKEKVSQKPITNTNIYLSAPGSAYSFQISKTDSTGRFYFITKNIQTQTGIQFQIDPSSNFGPFEILLDDEFVNDYKRFKPLPLLIDTALRKRIEQRNVYSQIENAYFTTKRDSIFGSTKEPFFGKPDKIYKLDDFTRFPTMEDIFREYMFEVVVTKRDEKFAIRLINGNIKNAVRFLNTPLILVDGIPVSDTEIIMNYNPLLIKTVSLVVRPYVYSGILFDGVLLINTYTGNAKELPITSTHKDYTSWQRTKKYYSPVYNTSENLKRIPDYRVQLFWNPIITIEPGQEFSVEFYTSDVEGEFLIEVKGFNSNGAVVNIRDNIEIQK